VSPRHPLVHNASNPITEGIWRVDGPDGPTIHKRISRSVPPRHPDWHASTDPSDWRYWRREAHVYEEGLQHVFAPEGLRGPALLALTDHGDTVDLHLEAVTGTTGAQLSRAQLVDVAERLGAAQGRLAHTPVQRPWLSRHFLRDHIRSKHVDYDRLDDDACWAHPLIRDGWPASLRQGLSRLAAHQPALLHQLQALPPTLCHLDLWNHNLVVTDRDVVLLDWACAGTGAPGEDVSNLAIEAVLDELQPASALADLGHELLGAYQRGLATAGGVVTEAQARAGFLAAAVKWVWLGPLHLERALTGVHHVYGGAVATDPARQIQVRGMALEQIVAWADEALR